MPDIVTLPAAIVGDHLNEETIDSFVPSPEGSVKAFDAAKVSQLVQAVP